MERGWIDDTSARKVYNFLDETDTKFEFFFNFFYFIANNLSKSLVFHKFNGKYCEQNNLIDRCHYVLKVKICNVSKLNILKPFFTLPN